MRKTNPDGTVVSDLTSDSRSTASTATSSSLLRESHRNRKEWNNYRGTTSNVAIESFKGANN